MEALCAIDIGNSKVAVMVAKASEKKPIEVIAYKSTFNTGMKDGLIVDIEKTTKAIGDCLDLVEEEIGLEITEAYVSISSTDMMIVNSKGIAKVKREQVSVDDIKSAIELSRVHNFSTNVELLHSIVQKHTIDGKTVNNAIDIHGVRLEIDSLLVAINQRILDNLSYCLNHCGVEIEDALIAPYASSIACLSDDDLHLGVIHLDMGAGLTDITVYKDSHLAHLDSVPIAGEKITKAIAHFLNTSIEQAEKLKCKYGCVDPDLIENPSDEISIHSARENQVNYFSLGEFSEIVSNFYHQCFSQIRDHLEDSLKLENIQDYGVVISGGMSDAPGITQLAKEIFGASAVRIAYPSELEINLSEIKAPKASLANIAGLIIHANRIHHHSREQFALTKLSNRKIAKKPSPKAMDLITKIKGKF